MELQAPDEEAMVNVAVADLDDMFESISKEQIESTVRRLVREWLSCSRIKTFVGIIVERHARVELASLGPERESRAGA